MEREEYNAGPPAGKKIPKVVGIFLLRIGWKAMSAAFKGQIDCVFIHNLSTYSLQQLLCSLFFSLVNTKPENCER